MSSAFNKFNSYQAFCQNGAIDCATETFKVMLTNTVPVATNQHYSDISGNEIANGNGYTTGGLSIVTTSSSQTSGVYSLILADSSTLTATGSVGPFRYAVVYGTVSAVLVGWFDYGSAITMAASSTFQFQPDLTNGLYQVT